MMRMNQSRIMKLSSRNRLLFIRLCGLFASLSCASITFGCSTNEWLYTAEWLKYHEEKNRTTGHNESIPEYLLPKYFKNATVGPWVFCFEEPNVASHCRQIEHWTSEESADTTMSVEIGVRKVVFVLVAAVGWVYCALLATLVCNVKSGSALIALTTGLAHIIAGMTILLCLVLYVANVTREVGKKLWPESALDKPLFYYNYGYSFYTVVASYVCTQLAAFFVLSVYMAKHDEKMYNRYQIRALLRSNMLASFGGVGLSVVPAKRTSGAGGNRNNRYTRTAARAAGADTFSFSSAASVPNSRTSAKSSNASACDSKQLSLPPLFHPCGPYEHHQPILREESEPEGDDEENGPGTLVNRNMPPSYSQLSTCPLLPALSQESMTDGYSGPLATSAL